MRLPDYYRFCSRVRILSGHGSVRKLPQVLSSLQVSRPMIITDSGIVHAGLLSLVKDPLEGSGIPIAAEYTEVSSDSDVNTVNILARLYLEQSCDSIIAVGGGSVIDTAKGVNMIVSNDQGAADIREIAGAGVLTHRLSPLIAVPTTSGTGSEVTMVAVIEDHETQRKLLFTSYVLQPDVAILDSDMTMTLPPALTAATGMDAMTHAIEAYTGLGKNPLSDAMALQAMKLITGNLEHVVKNPSDRNGRLALAVGSNLAGQAFSNSMVGIVHTIGHTVGSICGIHHGLCMSILLPYGLEYNMHKISHLLEEIAPVVHPGRVSAASTAEETIEGIREMNRRLCTATDGAHATRLHDVIHRDGKSAMKPDHISIIAQASLGDGSQFYNPEQLDYEDVVHILEAAYWGYPLDRELIQKGHQR